MFLGQSRTFSKAVVFSSPKDQISQGCLGAKDGSKRFTEHPSREEEEESGMEAIEAGILNHIGAQPVEEVEEEEIRGGDTKYDVHCVVGDESVDS